MSPTAEDWTSTPARQRESARLGLESARLRRDRLAAELRQADHQVDLGALLLRRAGATLAEVADVGGWSGPAGAAKAILRAEVVERLEPPEEPPDDRDLPGYI